MEYHDDIPGAAEAGKYLREIIAREEPQGWDITPAGPEFIDPRIPITRFPDRDFSLERWEQPTDIISGPVIREVGIPRQYWENDYADAPEGWKLIYRQVHKLKSKGGIRIAIRGDRPVDYRLAYGIVRQAVTAALRPTVVKWSELLSLCCAKTYARLNQQDQLRDKLDWSRFIAMVGVEGMSKRGLGGEASVILDEFMSRIAESDGGILVHMTEELPPDHPAIKAVKRHDTVWLPGQTKPEMTDQTATEIDVEGMIGTVLARAREPIGFGYLRNALPEIPHSVLSDALNRMRTEGKLNQSRDKRYAPRLPSARDLAEHLTVGYSTVTRLRKQGMSDPEIIAKYGKTGATVEPE